MLNEAIEDYAHLFFEDQEKINVVKHSLEAFTNPACPHSLSEETTLYRLWSITETCLLYPAEERLQALAILVSVYLEAMNGGASRIRRGGSLGQFKCIYRRAHAWDQYRGSPISLTTLEQIALEAWVATPDPVEYI